MNVGTTEYMLIGTLAEKTGTSPRAIRHYETMGLIAPISKTVGGVRLYGKDELRRLQLILRLKILGVELQKMREVAPLCSAPEESRSNRAVTSLTKLLKQIREKISVLQSLEAEIAGIQNMFEECEPNDS